MAENKGFKDVKSEGILILENVKAIFFRVIISFLEQVRLFSYSKVLLNVTLTFIFPIIMFSIPILEEAEYSFSENIFSKLNSGVLFSTSISISATIISTYVDNAKVNLDINQDKVKVKLIDKVLPLLIYSFLITILGAFFYGQMANNEKLSSYGMAIQICLYILVQIVYGVMDSKIKNSKSKDLFKNQEKYDEQNEEKLREEVEILNRNKNIKNSSNKKKI